MSVLAGARPADVTRPYPVDEGFMPLLLATISMPTITKQIAPVTPRRTTEATVERNSRLAELSEACFKATDALPLRTEIPKRKRNLDPCT